MEKYNYISELFLFDNVDFKEINNKYDIVDHAIEVEYKPGTIIQSAESPPLGIGIVIGGSATIYADSKPYEISDRKDRKRAKHKKCYTRRCCESHLKITVLSKTSI